MDSTELDSTQFTMLGLTGSDKTCYLLGMYKRMAGGSKGFSLETDDDTDVNLRRRYKRMQDTTLGRERFPAGTDQPDSYKFKLTHGIAPIMSFEWIDYPGGALDEQTTGDIEAFSRLEKHIQNSSSLFICVDGELIQGDDCDEIADNIKDNCSETINHFLHKFFQKNNFLPPTAIIVTKADLCKELDDSKLEYILREAFSPLLTDGNDEYSRFVCCIPVSLGRDIETNNYNGKLNPRNIELPIYMGIYFSMFFKWKRLQTEEKNNKQQMNNLNYETLQELNSFFLWRDDKKINTNKETVRKLSALDKKIQESMKSALNGIKLLLNVLDERIGMAFFNGKRRKTFSEASQNYCDNQNKLH